MQEKEIKFLDKNGKELKPGMWVVAEGDTPKLIVGSVVSILGRNGEEVSGLGMDATNYEYYENRHNSLIRETRNGEKIFGKYVPKVELAYPLDNFELKRIEDKFMLVDFEICEKPEGVITPERLTF